MPDLAATLHTAADHDTDADADEANVSLIRVSLESPDWADSTQASLSPLDPQRDPRRYPRLNRDRDTQHAAAQTSADTLHDLARLQRLQRVLARLNHIHDPSAASPAAAYSNRTPSPNRQSLYDWAPSHEEPGREEERELDSILAELRRQQPDTHPDILRVLSQSQLDSTRQPDQDTHATSTADAPEAADRRERQRERRRREAEFGLRSRAVLQRASARQEGSPSATERMMRYVMERERSGMSEEEERARGSGWFGSRPSGSGSGSRSSEHRNSNSNRESWPLPPSASEVRSRTLQERAEAMQRRYISENAPPRLPRISTPPLPVASTPTSVHPQFQFLENALKYLNQLRSCYNYEDALSAAIDHGLATKEFFADKHDDFVMDMNEVNPIAASSWLQPGTVFEGHQHATNTNAALLHSRPGQSAHSVEQINPNFRNQGTAATTGFDHPPGSTRVAPFDATRPWLSHQFIPPSLRAAGELLGKSADTSHDHWPVRVVIHSVDREQMRIAGIMEAYDVPQHPASVSILHSSERPKAGKKHAPITTYLEGHIIDLATHSFLTPCAEAEKKQHGPHATMPHNMTPYTTLPDYIAFPLAGAHTDASNWRKLPPFNTLPSDDETARCILSKARMNEIHEEYIFMRWKERCFVHTKDDKCSAAERAGDQDRGHGLTISGFYYVSLRRSDGVVEGLYFDPQSTPYQHLRLSGHRSGWPAFEFR